MKKQFYTILISTILIVSISPSQAKNKNKKLHEFVMDLSSANNNLKGKLSLYGEYKGDLSTLNYKQYLLLLKENESFSDRGLAKRISRTNNQVFAAQKHSFLIALYSKKFNMVLYDDANTDTLDSLMILPKGGKIPDLIEFIGKHDYKSDVN